MNLTVPSGCRHFSVISHLFSTFVLPYSRNTDETCTCSFLSPAHTEPHKDRKSKTKHFFTAAMYHRCAVNSPICMTRPNTDVLSTVLQFHLLCLNWYWHSLIPVLAPSPMYIMWSWQSWQSFLWPCRPHSSSLLPPLFQLLPMLQLQQTLWAHSFFS